MAGTYTGRSLSSGEIAEELRALAMAIETRSAPPETAMHD